MMQIITTHIDRVAGTARVNLGSASMISRCRKPKRTEFELHKVPTRSEAVALLLTSQGMTGREAAQVAGCQQATIRHRLGSLFTRWAIDPGPGASRKAIVYAIKQGWLHFVLALIVGISPIVFDDHQLLRPRRPPTVRIVRGGRQSSGGTA